MRVSFEADFSRVNTMLREMAANVEAANLDKFLETEVGDVLRDDFDRQFSVGGYPEKWEPLAESTVKGKAYAGYPRANRFGKATKAGTQGGAFGPENILIRKGDLRVSWTKKNGADHVCRSRQGLLEIGSENPYAIYHQSDEPRKMRQDGKPRLPRRPIVITEEAMRKTVEITVGYIIGSRRR